MRISLAMRYETLVRHIGAKQEQIARLTEDLADGERLRRPSDDPAAWSRAAGWNESLRRIASYRENIDFATGVGNQSEAALNQWQDLLTKASDLGIRAMSITPAAGVPELEQVIEEALQIANQEYSGRYLFGGDAGTESTAAPFAVTRDADGSITAVGNFQSYNSGDPWETMVRVGKQTTQVANVDGRALFLDDPAVDSSGGTADNNVLQHLVALRDAMQAGDTDAIETQLGAIATAQQRARSQSSGLGSRLTGLERRGDFLMSLQLDDQERLSDLKDADLAATVTDLQLKGTALEAAYQVATMLDGLNLQDYL